MKISNCITTNSGVFLNQNTLKQTKKNINNSSENHSYTSRLQFINQNYSYYPISFKRKMSEHKSWGAIVDPKTKNVSFKLFAYPDAKRVTANVIKQDTGEITEYNLTNKGKGIFEAKDIPADRIQSGDSYFFTIEREVNGEEVVSKVKDPYAYCVRDGYSVIQDHSSYQWNDSEWFSKDNTNRISRLATAGSKQKPVRAARIYEFHTQTHTKEGTYEVARKELDKIAALGFNAIEIMPVETTPFAFNWGYDGVDKFAPSTRMGEIDELKSLIDYAHSIGLNVIMDVVPNHINTISENLSETGPYLDGKNAFGFAYNYEGENSERVKDYAVNMVLNWLENYHCDGIRLDSSHNMKSDTTMKLIAAEVNYHKPDVFLIAEDKRSGLWGTDKESWEIVHPYDEALLSSLTEEEQCVGKNEDEHCKMIDDIANGRTSLSRIGNDSSWDFNFFRSLRELLYTGEGLDKFWYSSFCSASKVKYLMSHDSVGNYSGTRLAPKLMAIRLNLVDELDLDEQDKKRIEKLEGNDSTQFVKKQKADLVSEQLAVMLLAGQLDKYSDVDNSIFVKEVLKPLGFKDSTNVTYKKVKDTFNQSFDINKMSLALVYSLPGPKMVFQGDENSDLTPFRFFRHLDGNEIAFVDKENIIEIEESDQDKLYTGKGYIAGQEAYEQSKLGNINYDDNGKKLMDCYTLLTTDLNKLNDEYPVLVSGEVQMQNDISVSENPKVIAFHSVSDEDDSEIYSIGNFSDISSGNIENVKFPQGTWVEILNTDDKKYYGSGNTNANTIISDGTESFDINLSPRSTAIFKKIA